MVVQIQLRHDTAANWTAVDPTLAAGEVGVEVDTGAFKCGDGATAWNSLGYAPGSTVADILDLSTAEMTATKVLAPDGAGGVEFRAEAGGGSALTVADEGTPLATDATTIDFVGAGVVASGAGATKTITITGTAVADILDLPTAQMDDTLVLAPDGAGGVGFRAETGGGGGGATPAENAAALITAYSLFR